MIRPAAGAHAGTVGRACRAETPVCGLLVPPVLRSGREPAEKFIDELYGKIRGEKDEGYGQNLLGGEPGPRNLPIVSGMSKKIAGHWRSSQETRSRVWGWQRLAHICVRRCTRTSLIGASGVKKSVKV